MLENRKRDSEKEEPAQEAFSTRSCVGFLFINNYTHYNLASYRDTTHHIYEMYIIMQTKIFGGMSV